MHVARAKDALAELPDSDYRRALLAPIHSLPRELRSEILILLAQRRLLLRFPVAPGGGAALRRTSCASNIRYPPAGVNHDAILTFQSSAWRLRRHARRNIGRDLTLRFFG
jgi:hypothetical protein